MLAPLVVVVVTLHVAAADPAPCANPRAAAATVLSNLRDDRFDLRKAARCADEAGTTRAEREHALEALKLALDAVGARVKLDDISNDPGFLDDKTFEPTVVLTRDLPRLRLERLDDGQWMIPRSVLTQADQIYDDAVAVDLHSLKKKLPAWAQRQFFGVAAWQLLALLVLVGLGLVVRAGVVALLTWRAGPLLAALGIQASRERIALAMRPLGTLALAGVVALGGPSLALPARASWALLLGLRLLAAFSALAFCYRAVDVVAEQLVKRAAATSTKMDDHLVPLVRRLLKILVVSVAVAVVLEAFDVNVGSLIAGLGIGGLAVALAAKDTIGNFFGSVAIFLDRPFQIGDWIACADVEGTVEHVGFRSTQIRTIRDTLVTVPNAHLADANVDNFGARRSRRVRVTAGLEYATTPEQIEAFCDGVRAIVAAHPHTRKDDVEVHFNDFGDSALSFMVQFYVVRPTWAAELRARHEVLLDIVRLARDLGVRFAFPTRSVFVTQNGAAAAAAAAASASTDELLAVIRDYGPGGKKSVPTGPRILPAPPHEPVPAPSSAGAPPRQP